MNYAGQPYPTNAEMSADLFMGFRVTLTEMAALSDRLFENADQAEELNLSKKL